MKYRDLLKQELFRKIYSHLSKEEKLEYLTSRNHEEVMQSLREIKDDVVKAKHSWLADFGANVAGNAAFDGAVWVLSKLIKKL